MRKAGIILMGKFQLGEVVATKSIHEKVAPVDVLEALRRHVNGDWGDICADDWQVNEEALNHECRLMSAYKTSDGSKIWVITEADRSVTTVLFPDEY